MNHALTRTRRNMIGVSAVLTAVFALGWQFPSELRIFGNGIEASPQAVMIIAWASLACLVWEYIVHLQTLGAEKVPEGSVRETLVAIARA